jgi:histidinol-phosphate aminotransferase
MKFREAYREIALYEPGRLPIEIDLSDNTNLFGVAPAARALLDALPNAIITRYPSVFAQSLKRALALKHGVAPENITTGCGSDDVIDSAVRAFCEPGDKVAFPSPTFGVVSTFAKMNATKPIGVAMRPDFSFDTDKLVAAAGGVTYVCSPNNPTGSTVPAEQIAQLDKELPGVLLLDEAYADYGDADYARFTVQSQRTVSLRTMSKACGLAGLRVGYAIGPAAIIHEIEKSRGPYKVSGVAEAVAVAVLSADTEWVSNVVAETRALRSKLAGALARLPIKQFPSAGNFILVQLTRGTALGTNTALRKYGVSVRPFTALPYVGEGIRVTVGPWEMMQRFLKAFESVESV